VSAGFTVHVPGATADVLDVVGRQSPLVAVVMDARPRGPQATLAQQLARLRPRSVLVAVSGWPRDQLSCGDVFDDYLLKPCLPDAIVAALRGAVWPTP
jgi:DNA-binding NarL/FixJ family response regulator